MKTHNTSVVVGFSHPTLLSATLCFAILVLTGCAGISKEAGFSAVQQEVDERIGYRVQWNQNTGADNEAAQAVRELLDKPLTADTAVQIALLNNRRLQANYEALGVAQAAVIDAGLLSNPIFHGVATFGLSDDEAVAEAKDDSTYTFEVEMDFLSIFYAPMRKSVAQAEFEAAKLRVTAAVIDLAGQTRKTFYRVQADGQMLDMFQQVVLATQAGYEFAQKLQEAGNIPELDLFLQRALYERSRLELAAAEVAEAESREALNRLMGLWGQDTAWTVESRLPDIPADAMLLDDLEKQAIEKSIDLAIARQAIVSVGKQLRVENTTKLVPVLDLGTEIEKEEGKWKAGPALGFVIPLFDRNQGRRAAAAAELRRQQQEYYALAVEIRSAVRTARRRLLTARRTALFYQQEMLPLQASILDQVQLEYNAMQIGTLRLLLAKQQEIDAGRGYIQSLLNYHIAKAELDQILNGRLGVSTSTTPSMEFRVPGASSTANEGGH